MVNYELLARVTNAQIPLQHMYLTSLRAGDELLGQRLNPLKHGWLHTVKKKTIIKDTITIFHYLREFQIKDLQ